MKAPLLFATVASIAPHMVNAQSDTPCGAPLLPVYPSSCSFQVFTTAGAAYQNDPANGGTAPCAFPGSPDVWFSVVVPPSGSIAITTEEGTITDGGMAVYRGPCTAPVLIECDDDAAVGMMPVVDRSDYIPGETLYIRLWKGANIGTGTFSICAVESHSDCREAIPVCHSFHMDGNPYGPGSVVDVAANFCDIPEYQSEWFRFYFIVGGTFGFKIFPDQVNGVYPDYDWLLYPAIDTSFCGSHTPNTLPYACNGSSSTGTLGETGLDLSGVSNSVPSGPGNPFCQLMTVNAGALYYLFVNNFSTSSTGFQMDISGTAILDCGIPMGLPNGSLRTSLPLVRPCPANGSAWYTAGSPGIVQARLIDMRGREVRMWAVTGRKVNYLSLDGVVPGVYMVKGCASDGQVREVARLVVE